MSRYDKTRPFNNTQEVYQEFFEDRGVNYIKQYRTGRLKHPTIADRASLESIEHIWGLGDRMYKLAHRYYGDSRFWWVIAWYNGRPTEGHYKTGTLVYIPQPLNRVLAILKRT